MAACERGAYYAFPCVTKGDLMVGWTAQEGGRRPPIMVPLYRCVLSRAGAAAHYIIALEDAGGYSTREFVSNARVFK
eukprot:7982075-Pyramimonas_sp.AAC.1